MARQFPGWLVAAWLVVWPSVAAPQSRLPPAAAAAATEGDRRLLDVPYLSQTEDLCGGAAAAMVLRYWGAREIFPEDFRPLVDRQAAGIRTDVLTADLRLRGWQALVLDAGVQPSVQLARGRPVIALIEVRPQRFHYVVVVAWTADLVIVHDPAAGPYQTLSHLAFERAWAAAGHWALVVVPGSGAGADEARIPDRQSPVAVVRGSADQACEGLAQEMVVTARAGRLADAEMGLRAATRLCPGTAVVWRELAGVLFLQQHWAEASLLAERATSLAPGDAGGWNLLATSRYLAHEPEGALDAWNQVGRPAVDLLHVSGTARTHDPVLSTLVALPPRSVLTAASFGRASRRLAMLPSATSTALRYRLVPGGRAEIEATVVEPPVVPRTWTSVAALGARALLTRELKVAVVAPSSAGELWTAGWRWQRHRPRVRGSLSVPAASWMPGVTTIGVVWEQNAYARADVDRAPVRVDHQRVAWQFADWATRDLEWSAGAALDVWNRQRRVGVEAGLGRRLAGDRLALELDAAGWVPAGRGDAIARGALAVAWRSTTHADRRSMTGVAGVEAVSATAPFDLWPGADIGQARAPLLRAHPLLRDGVVTGAVFGRSLSHATLEYQQPLPRVPASWLQVVAFVDVASAWRRGGRGVPPAWQADAGLGVRLGLAGQGGAVRVEAARGLRDGHLTVQGRWETGWRGR